MPQEMVSDATITIRLKQGISQSEIAREFGMTRQAISARLKYKEKMTHPVSSTRRFTVVFLRRLGFTLPEIVNFVGYTETHIRQILKRNRISSTDFKCEHISPKETRNMRSFSCIFLFRIGFTIPEIAVMTEYNMFAVYNYIKKHGYLTKGRC